MRRTGKNCQSVFLELERQTGRSGIHEEVARRRGRETFKPVFDELPEAVLFFYRFMVADPGFWNYYATALDPVAAMKAKGDLWIPFMNGMLDVIPWTAKVVEGDETGYRYESKFNWFHYARTLQRNCAQRLVAPGNTGKFRARIIPLLKDGFASR